MSFADDLLIILSEYHGGYRLIRQRLTGRSKDCRKRSCYAVGKKKVVGETMRVTLSRLKEKGFVENNQRGVWDITPRGMKLAVAKAGARHAREENLRKPKSLIVAFDIPEREAQKRQWLRLELRALGFEMLQKSVWFGPSPLPCHIVDGMRSLRLLGYVKFFRAQVTDIV
ncbi:MAG: hypothetical protein AAB759_03355 [Patescibacteria group bacterium]